MTPEQATMAIASVRDYRQGLTARAAGLVWMVWGLAFALMASVDMIGLVVTNDDFVVRESCTDTSATESTCTTTYWPGFAPVLMPLASLVAAVLTTNAIWKAHALERGDRHRSWVAWLGIVAIVAAALAIGFATFSLNQAVSGPDAPEQTYIIVMPLVAAVGAAFITVLQRRRVGMLPGLIAAVLLVGLELLLPFLTAGSLDAKVVQGVHTAMLGIVTVFVATGLWYYKRG